MATGPEGGALGPAGTVTGTVAGATAGVATGKPLVAPIGMVMLGAGVTTGVAPMLGAAILIY